MAEFDVNVALKAYLDDPLSIVTPEADSGLLDCESDPDAFTTGMINGVLNEISSAVGENPESIMQPGNLHSIQFLLKQTAFIPQASLSKVVDLVISGLGAEAETVYHAEQDGESETAQHKQVLEIFAFLLQWCIAALEAKSTEKSASAPSRGKGAKGTKGKGSAHKDVQWDPSGQLQTALDTMTKVMKLKLPKIFVTTSERDTFIGLFTRPSYLILENEARVKSTGVRMHVFKVLCVAIKHHGHAYGAQTSVIQNLTYFEHLADPMAEFLSILIQQYDYPQLAEEVMKELSNKEFSANDTKGPKSVSTFVARLSELEPRQVQKQVTYLAKLLESENYTLRCAIIEVCGNLIAMLSTQEEGERSENHKGQLNAFFDVLEERFLDINPYCRCRAIQVFAKLCDLDAKYPKRRQTAAELATRSLEDKSSNVRRNAMKLLGRLMATHPFAVLHGGLLSYREWSDRLESCEAEINTLKPPSATGLEERDSAELTLDEGLADEATHVEESPMSEEQQKAALEKAEEEAATADALRKLQLTRTYYQHALDFIEVLHKASMLVTQLLGSRTKTEVVEAMDFFVISDAYHVETAKAGIRRMLRLIWTNSNNDEGKGVTSHLVECYRGLFFDAPKHFSTSDAATYVARNMISLTFGASPAELASMEKLLETMMKEKQVSELVLQKLWQVYGVQKQEISRRQRRGAIIILGMLALADPNIIIQEMETCLRIGLGALGQKDLVLARYTCIALMRMTDNKHTKGTQIKPSTRLPNDHAVLVRLANLLNIQTSNSEWYGLAEKAIGAIYALSKHPDLLCGDVIRTKTKLVFAPKANPSTAKEAEASGVDNDGDVEMSDMAVQETAHYAAPESGTNNEEGSTHALSQLLFAVGHIGLKQIVHLDLCEQDFKRRKADKEKVATAPSPIKKTPNAATQATKKAEDKKKQEEEDELDLMAGTNEDDFVDAINNIREREILYGRQSLLANFGPLVQEICSNPAAYANAELQAQAALCMAKLMCVSRDYCDANLDLFVIILERSPSPTIRSNLMVALGDMAVCFNNLVSDNTDFLYRRLSDRALQVRRTCMMTLTFLILAGQIKVKGQMAQMAKCVEDSDLVLRDMSRMFFAELSTKDNAIYNNFLDMFSLLSSDEGLEEDQFRKIIKFLATFIEKVSASSSRMQETTTDMSSHRTNLPSNSPTNWLHALLARNPNGSGMTLRLRSAYCPTRMRTSLKQSRKAARLSRLPPKAFAESPMLGVKPQVLPGLGVGQMEEVEADARSLLSVRLHDER
nr:condensin complex subunit 1 [Quercus suber]